MSNLAYCIPLIHPSAVHSWVEVCNRLCETVSSLINASGSNAGIFIGTNREASLPKLPLCVTNIPLDIPPPASPVFRHAALSEETHRELVRLDKGLKLLAAITQARACGYQYIMTVDADDLVSNRVPQWVKHNLGVPGWYVQQGWLHTVGSRWIYREPQFHEICGTCFIIRIDILDIPTDPSLMPEDAIKKKLGSHKFLTKILESRGTPLAPLPFPGGVYRIGHEGNVSETVSLKALCFQRYMLRQRPLKFAKNLLRLRPLTRSFQSEFGLNCPKVVTPPTTQNI